MTEGDRVTPTTTVKVTHLPTGFAVTKVTPAVRKKMVELITKATG